MRGIWIGVLAAAAWLVVLAPGAGAAVPDSLKRSCERRDAADANASNGVQLPFWFCDDGVPDQGGTTPNPGAAKAIAVPQRYGGDGFSGLPSKTSPEAGTGADPNGDIAIDANVTLPDPDVFPPNGRGYPLVVLMHGCCAGDKTSWEAPMVDTAGEKWHYSNAWFASRGYVVLTYTARGFVNGQNRGSTGQAQLNSRRYEINDYQHMAGQLADTSFTVGGKTVTVDPSRVVATGGSYGGGFSWLAATDPTWTSPGGKAMKLVAAAPKYGWSDLVYSLVPNGHHLRDMLPPTDPAVAGKQPMGIAKRSIVAGLYASGKTGVPPGSNHTTFPSSVDRDSTCLQSSLPYSSNPACTATLAETLPEFLNDRSAYYQNGFFERIKSDRNARVAIFSAGTFTDPLFTPVEHRRMAERLRANVRDYPIQEYYGDYQHFVQNKSKEWADLCGADDHPCRVGEYPGQNFNSEPGGLRRAGVTTRLNRLVDHYAKPPANANESQPTFDVTAGLQICPANAGGPFPADQPGERLTETTFGELAPKTLRLQASGNQTTTNDAEPNQHAAGADPVANSLAQTNAGRCPVETTPAGAGVATYDFPSLANDAVMIGRTRVTVPHTGSGSDLQLNARLYEVFPNGQQVMVDRGVRTVTNPNETTVFDLHGNGWRFTKGNRLRLELAQDDDPFMRVSATASSMTLTGATLDIPIRDVGPDAVVKAPLLLTDVSRSRQVPVTVMSRSGETTGLSRVELTARATAGPGKRSVSVSASSFKARLGRTFRFRGRVFDRRGVAGDYAEAMTIVPVDDKRSKTLRYRGKWRRIKGKSAYGSRLSRATKRGARLRFRFRGDRLYMIGRKGPRGGKARLYIGKKRRTINFYSARTRNRVVVLQMKINRKKLRRIRVVVLGRKGHRRSKGRRVEIDAIGVRQP